MLVPTLLFVLFFGCFGEVFSQKRKITTAYHSPYALPYPAANFLLPPKPQELPRMPRLFGGIRLGISTIELALSHA